VPELVADCPRCRSKRITFDVTEAHITHTEYSWQQHYEVFSICRQCNRSTIFALEDDGNADYDHFHQMGLLNCPIAINKYVIIKGFVSLKDFVATAPPDHVPENIAAVFREGATCLAVDCNNAAATMFRLCIDLATRRMLPAPTSDNPPTKVRRDLGLRLPWLFDNDKLPEALRDLSTCVREDGNDGAHEGTLTEEEAEDLRDFTTALLERIYTEPVKIRLAQERRETRRAPPNVE